MVCEFNWMRHRESLFYLSLTLFRYDHVRGIQESLSGLEIMKVADDHIEVRVLKSHLVRLFCDPETTRLQRVQVSHASSACLTVQYHLPVSSFTLPFDCSFRPPMWMLPTSWTLPCAKTTFSMCCASTVNACASSWHCNP